MALKRGMWVQMRGFRSNRKWNGVTGFVLDQKEGSELWIIFVPTLCNDEGDGQYEMDPKFLFPLDGSQEEVRIGDWVRAHGFTLAPDMVPAEYVDVGLFEGAAGWVVGMDDTQMLVCWPPLIYSEVDDSDVILSMPREHLQRVPIVAPRLVRKERLDCVRRSSLNFMRVRV